MSGSRARRLASPTRFRASLLSAALVTGVCWTTIEVTAVTAPQGPAAAAPVRSQPRPHGARVAVPVAAIDVDDGDTVAIRGSKTDVETVRILGIDCPETRHPEHDLPHGQPFGDEARAFARGAFGSATEVTLLRASMLDLYGRTLGYLFVNGRNYSLLVIRARLAEETVTRYGDNGLPKEAADVKATASDQGRSPSNPPARSGRACAACPSG